MTSQITFLGTADGAPCAARAHAALLVDLAGQRMLLDCGEPCSRNLKIRGISYDSLDGVVISHTHNDHVGGLPMLLQAMWLETRRRPLSLWLPAPAIAPLQRWLQHGYLFPEALPFRVRWRRHRPGAPWRTGALTGRSWPTTHLEPTRRRFQRRYPQVGYAAYGIGLAGGGKRIAYSGDLGAVSDLVPLCRRPLDLLVVELAHIHPRDLVAFLRDRPIARIAVTHLGRPARQRFGSVRRCLQVLGRHRVVFPRDGDVVRF